MTKHEAYVSGHYMMEVPPVHTVFWDEAAWIRWIEQTGFWTVDISE